MYVVHPALAPWGLAAASILLVALSGGCSNPDPNKNPSDSDSSAGDLPCEPISSECGPSAAVVERVIDGDTIELEGGMRVRYLMVDTPENTTKKECYGEEAYQFNKDFVEGQTVCLYYDEQECSDHFGRLLAYVETADGEINRSLVIRGLACVCYIPPSGSDRKNEFEELEEQAKTNQTGLWSVCPADTCGCN